MLDALSERQIERILDELVPDALAVAPPHLLRDLTTYLQLLMRWNSRMNLSAIRDPELIVRRHFAESLFAAVHLPETGTLLDLGSGAGFPGLPIQLLRPDLQVTLAESQTKKASFLREVARTLGLTTRIWPTRAELFPAGTVFDIVTLRAVDNMASAIVLASELAFETLCILTGATKADHLQDLVTAYSFRTYLQPGSEARILLLGNRTQRKPSFHVKP